MGDGKQFEKLKGLFSTRLRLALAASFAVTAVLFWKCLPEPLFNDPLSTVLASREGALLGAKISGDGKRLREAFIKTFLAISLLVIPAGIFLYVFTAEVVALLLGSGWQEVIPIVKVLAFFGVIRGGVTATYPLFLSLKKQNYITVITLGGILGLGVTVIPLVSKHGVLGAAYAALIGSLFSVPLAGYFIYKVFKQLR